MTDEERINAIGLNAARLAAAAEANVIVQHEELGEVTAKQPHPGVLDSLIFHDGADITERVVEWATAEMANRVAAFVQAIHDAEVAESVPQGGLV